MQSSHASDSLAQPLEDRQPVLPQSVECVHSEESPFQLCSRTETWTTLQPLAAEADLAASVHPSRSPHRVGFISLGAWGPPATRVLGTWCFARRLVVRP